MGKERESLSFRARNPQVLIYISIKTERRWGKDRKWKGTGKSSLEVRGK